VTYDSTTGDADVIGVDVGGTLRFYTAGATRLRVGTLMVLPSGALEVGTSSNPIPAAVTAEIICDGHHVHPSLVAVAIRVKRRTRLSRAGTAAE
jgi:hypothetical protein